MVDFSKFSDETLARYNIKREELGDLYNAYLKFAVMNSYANCKVKKRVYKKKYCKVCDMQCTNIYTHCKSVAHLKKLESKDTNSDAETVNSEDDI